jgi:archaellum component FlaC
MTTLRLVSAAATQDNPSIQELGAALSSSASAALIVQTYCNQILQQPDIEIPASVINKLPPIKKYLEDAKAHGNNYLKNIQPNMIKVVTDVGGYSQQFTNFYNLIDDRLNDWKGGDKSAKEDAMALLQQLQNALDDKKKSVIVVSKDLNNFITDINQDISNFHTASIKADTIIGGDQGSLASLDSAISKIDTTISVAIAGIAISGLVTVGGGLLVAVGSIANFVTAGTSTPVIVAGVALVVVGVAGVTASSIVLKNTLEAKSKLLQQKAELNANLIFLKNFKSTIGTLETSASLASSQLGSMSNAWVTLGNNMGNVIQALDNARTYSELTITVQAYLNTANTQWMTVQKNVQILQEQMAGVKTTVLKDSQGNLGMLDSNALGKLISA